MTAKRTLAWIGYSLMGMACFAFALRTIQKIDGGYALEWYMTGRGLRANHLWAAISLSTLALGVLAGWGLRVLRWWSGRRLRHFEKP